VVGDTDVGVWDGEREAVGKTVDGLQVVGPQVVGEFVGEAVVGV